MFGVASSRRWVSALLLGLLAVTFLGLAGCGGAPAVQVNGEWLEHAMKGRASRNTMDQVEILEEGHVAGDPDFETLYRRRNDAESINRHLDDTLWLRRAHTVGARRQLLNVITYAMGVNAMTMRLHRSGVAPPQAA